MPSFCLSKRFFSSSFIFIIILFANQVRAELSDNLPKMWINGANCDTEPKGQVHQYNANLFIIRQSVCTHFEAPFIYLFFGKEKVLMLDSGASNFGQRQLVDDVIKEWLARNNLEAIELIIAHTHGHSDHVAGDSLFNDRANTTIIDKNVESITQYFGFKSWPEGVIQLDLGNRIIDVLPLPGHQDAHIALYDYDTQILFTGDSLYPGRIYFKQENFKAFSNSMVKLNNYAQDKPVKHILGTHIEMTNRAGMDFPFEAKNHLNERRLELNVSHLEKIVNWLPKAQTPVKKKVFDDFILYPTN